MPLMFDQGQLGSCTANATGAAYAIDRRLDHPRDAAHPHAWAGRPSRLFIYYGERMLEGQLGQGDTGAFGRDGFKFMQKYGTVSEQTWPYYINKYAINPPQTVWDAALSHKLTKPYVSVPQDETSIRSVLSNNQTIAFGFTVYDSFEYQTTFDSGIVPMPLRSESTLGGHEILAIGYLAAYPNHVLCRNSWGADIYQGVPGFDVYGGGYLLFPLQYLTDPNLASDLRTIVRPIV